MNKNRTIANILNELIACDDYHNRCDYLMEHNEITYLLDYIKELEKENEELQERINKAIEYIEENTCWDLRTGKVLEILKGED